MVDAGKQWNKGMVTSRSCPFSSPQMDFILLHLTATVRYMHLFTMTLAIHTSINIRAFIPCHSPMTSMSLRCGWHTSWAFVLSDRKTALDLFFQSENGYHFALWNIPVRSFVVYTFGILHIESQLLTMFLKFIVFSDVKEWHLERDPEELVVEKVTVFNLPTTPESICWVNRTLKIWALLFYF
jgi:hypothetical protein